MATYDLTLGIPSKINTGDILNCPYSGNVITITLPKGQFKLECWGAQGGTYDSYYGGRGGYSTGLVDLSADTVFYLVTGGLPASSSTLKAVVPGGYNGGGNGFNRYWNTTYTYGQGGGGASDIRIGTNSMYTRAIVAGGGGGSASQDAALTKYGGGLEGGSPLSGFAGTLTAGGTATNNINHGSFGTGGSVTTSGDIWMHSSGGGGGGFYGGGACSTYADNMPAYLDYNGGGSGYVYTEATASYYPSCGLSSDYYLSDAYTTAGNQSIPGVDGGTVTGREGNGYIRITVIKVNSFYRKLSDSWIGGESIYKKTDSTWNAIASIENNKYNKLILDIPLILGASTFIYDGTTKSIASKLYLSNYMSVSGNSDSVPGDKTATYTLTDNRAEWFDNTKAAKQLNWVIYLPFVSCDPNVTYTGSPVSPTWVNYYSDYMTIGGTTSATELGDYSTTFTLNPGLKWQNGTSEVLTVNWSIASYVTLSIDFNDISDFNNNITPGASNYTATIENNTVHLTNTTLDQVVHFYLNNISSYNPFKELHIRFLIGPSGNYYWPAFIFGFENVGWCTMRLRREGSNASWMPDQDVYPGTANECFAYLGGTAPRFMVTATEVNTYTKIDIINDTDAARVKFYRNDVELGYFEYAAGANVYITHFDMDLFEGWFNTNRQIYIDYIHINTP